MPNFNFVIFILGCLIASLAPNPLHAQSRESDRSSSDAVIEIEEARLRPSDANSLKIMNHFPKVVGMADKRVENVKARGILKYGRETRDFELIETAGGDRYLTLHWRYMGRHYKEVVAAPGGADAWKTLSKEVVHADNTRSWERIFVEKMKGQRVDFRRQFDDTVISEGQRVPAKPLDEEQQRVISGAYAEVPGWHFRTSFLFLHPFMHTINQQVGYQYQGVEELLGRDVYKVDYSKKQLFYFDKEKFLLVQWGSVGSLGGQRMFINYRSTAFKRWDGILFPSKIAILAKEATLGVYEVSSLETNVDFDSALLISEIVSVSD